jgi:hypothetical protein
MAVKSGNGGAVKIGANTVAEINKWSLSYGHNLGDTAAFGDTWEEKSPGLGRCSGSFSGSYDPSDTNGHVALRTAALNGTPVTLNLYEDATKYYSVSAYIEVALDVEESQPAQQASYTFTGSGELSYN